LLIPAYNNIPKFEPLPCFASPCILLLADSLYNMQSADDDGFSKQDTHGDSLLQRASHASKGEHMVVPEI
jgi:hypothetical protein